MVKTSAKRSRSWVSRPETQKTVVTGCGDVQEASGRGAGGRQRRVLLLRGTDEARTWSAGWFLRSRGRSRRTRSSRREVYVLTKEEGGRHTPFFNGYRPQFYFRTTDVTGIAEPSFRRREDGDAR